MNGRRTGGVVLLSALITAGADAAPPCAEACRPGTLRTVKVGPGPEDMAWDAKRSRLLLSTADRSAKAATEGHIQALPLSDDGPAASATDLPRDGRPEGRRFYPVGLSLLETDGDTLLYVIVRGVGKEPDRVEKYRVEADRLVYLDHFESPLLVTANDVLALPGDELYVSNASRRRNPIRAFFEVAFKRRKSFVAHHRDGTWSKAAEKISFPNGIAASSSTAACPDGAASCPDRVYIASFNERRLLVFERDTATGVLTPATPKQIRLGAHPDNLLWDGPTLLVAAHPKRTRTFLHLLRGSRAPSVVYRVHVSGSPEVCELMREPGCQVAGSSTAFVYETASDKKLLIVSQVRRPSIGVCELEAGGSAAP